MWRSADRVCRFSTRSDHELSKTGVSGMFLMYAGIYLSMQSRTDRTERAVLTLLSKGPATPDEVGKELGIAWATAQGFLMRLVADGTLVSVRKGRVNVYLLKFPASVAPRIPRWAKPEDLRKLAGELEQYFPRNVTAADMVERERRRS